MTTPFDPWHPLDPPTVKESEMTETPSTESGPFGPAGPTTQPTIVTARVTWDGPEGFGVELNEDGVHLSKGRQLVLEECDLDRLLAIIEEAKRVKAAGLAPTPRVPDAATRARWSSREYLARRAAKASKEAIENELGAF